MRSVLFVLFALSTLAAAACGNDASSSPQPSTQSSSSAMPTDPKIKADQIFKNSCATCHGDDGKGNGLGAAQLEPKPRNYTDKAWQAATSDEQIKKVIMEGGAAAGKSPAMAPFGFMFKDDPAALDAMVKKIRAFGS
jgi:mono/diheme cytochrome c family protein